MGIGSQVEGGIHPPHLPPCLVSLLLPVLNLLGVTCAFVRCSKPAWHPELVMYVPYAEQACCSNQQRSRLTVHRACWKSSSSSSSARSLRPLALSFLAVWWVQCIEDSIRQL